MPKITTIEYDREELRQIAFAVLASHEAQWGAPVIGAITGKHVACARHTLITRAQLADAVRLLDKLADGKHVQVVALGAKGMKVRLTPKAEVAPEVMDE